MSDVLTDVRRVILGRIPDDFDPQRDIPLGPWCFAGREDVYSRWETLPFVRAFADVDDVARSSAMVQALAENEVERLAVRLNRKLGVERSSRFWRILILPWLLTLGQFAWCRYRYIESFVRSQERNELTLRLAAGDVEWGFRGMSDFYSRGIGGDSFNVWLSSLVLQALAPSRWHCQVMAPVAPGAPTGSDASSNGLIARYLDKARFSRVRGVRWLAPLLSLYLSLLKPRPASFPDRVRQGAAESFPAPFLEIWRHLLDRTMPLSLSEDFARLDAATSTHRFREGKLRVVGPVLNFDEETRFFYAHAVERGERLVSTQHGGVYGISRINTNMTEIEYRQEAFLSWGWDAHEDYEGHIIPLPSPYLSRYAGRHQERSPAILLVGNTARLTGFRTDCASEPTDSIQYRRARLAFIEALLPDLRPHLLYRPYYFDNMPALDDERFFLRNFPKLSICRGDIHPALLSCRLCVVDHPETTFLVALAANVPTIAFWDPAVRVPSRQARPFFDRLQDAGILFTTPEAAAHKLGQVWHNAKAWWQESAVQTARGQFCERYASTDRYWWRSWMRELYAL